MWSTSQLRFRHAAIGLLLVAIGIDFLAKGLAGYSAFHFRSPNAPLNAGMASIGSVCGLLIAGLAIFMWRVSVRRQERGSQLPVIVLISVYCLIFFIQV